MTTTKDKKYSEKTLAGYNICLTKLNKLSIDYKNITDGVAFVNDIRQIKSLKGGTLQSSGVKMYLSAVLWWYRSNNILNDELCKFTLEIKKIKDEGIEKYDNNKLDEKEKKVFVDWETVVGVYKTLHSNREKTQKHFRKCVIIGLYVLFPPRRLVDYAKMIVKLDDDELVGSNNYYVMNKKLFVFNVFKTSSTCEKIFTVPDDLCELLNEYIMAYNLIDKLLLGIDEHDLSLVIKKIMESHTGKLASVNTLRHSFISYMEHNKLIKSTKAKKELASKMGHSHHTQQEIYVKISDSESDN